MQSTYECKGKLWKYPGTKAAWYFITLPVALSREIKAVDAGPHRTGFGSLRVVAAIGSSTWSTSIFPSKPANAYLLPVKQQIRLAEELRVGGTVNLKLDVRRRA